MCGIAGIIDPEGFDPKVLASMTHLVSYRGPDGFGFAYFDNFAEQNEVIHNEDRLPLMPRPIVGLGCRRLAILDLSPSGNMPMQSADGNYCIAYNGEIYNWKEVRSELESRGYEFRTRTDTEVILAAYREWGEACLGRFNGMWSFAIWDARARRLFCARDRFGVKPFYYAVKGNCFFFGSEIKQVLLGSGMDRNANPEAVYQFLERGLIDYSAQTFFDGVHQLPGGHCLTIEVRAPIVCKLRRYWTLRTNDRLQISVDEAIEEFKKRFETAVRLRLRSDVPVGACLSGGLDSSSVVCQAKRAAPTQHFSTFSSCFEEPELDEREFISATVQATNGELHWVFPRKEDFWLSLDKILHHLDEPVPSTNVFAQWSVMAEARKNGTPVLLGGQGADEILCGYQKYRYFYLWHLLRKGDPKVFRESVLWFRNGTRSHWTWADAINYFPGVVRRSFSPVRRLSPTNFEQEFTAPSVQFGASGSLAERQKIDITCTSLPALLHYEDRNSMAHSIESRLPFLDYKLVEFAVSCPSSVKMKDGWSKWILRRALAGTLPEKVRLRKTKLGFDTPQADWMKYGLQNGHRGLWTSKDLQMSRFLSPQKLAREVEQFLTGKPVALSAGPLFRAVSLELWARKFSVS